jgi:isopenicillin N synthase-like dioxygenase
VKSVVNRVAVQLAKALQNKGMALLVNHGISEEKVEFVGEFDDIRTKFYGTFS